MKKYYFLIAVMIAFWACTYAQKATGPLGKPIVHEQFLDETLKQPGTPWANYGSPAFDNPDYYYAPIKSAPTGVFYRQAGLSPDGTKIVAGKQFTDGSFTRREVVLMNADGTGETVISPGNSGEGDIYQYGNPFWSDDGLAIGYVEVHNANPNKVVKYVVSGGATSYIYSPVSPNDVSNPDFLGTSTTSIVFWAYGPVGGADMFTWDGTTLTNITNTANYKEYEPVSNADGTKILFWSGETTAEPVNTTHTLTYSGGVWTKDIGFTPIADTYWSYWTDNTASGIATTVMSTLDLHIYDNTGGFVMDLTGPGYSGGSGQWNFFGSGVEGPNGEILFTSNAGRTESGRDIVMANPRTKLFVNATSGSDAYPGTEFAPFATIGKAITEAGAVTGGTVYLTAGTYSGMVFNTGTTVTLTNTTGGIVTFVGASPALTVTSGTLTVNGINYTTATNDPTILVNGGNLIMTNCTVTESTGYDQTGISVTSGSLDAGTTGTPGHNTFITDGGEGRGVTQTGGTATAIGNYWGSILGSAVEGMIVGTVAYDPWCNSDFSICGYTTSGGPKTYAGTIYSPAGTVVVPIRVKSFNDVNSVSLKMGFNTSRLTYVSGTMGPKVPAPTYVEIAKVGSEIVISYFRTAGFNLLDNDTLALITFTYDALGDALLTWTETDPSGTDLEYQNATIMAPYDDTPTSTYYIAGYVKTGGIYFTRQYPGYPPSSTTEKIIANPTVGTSPYAYTWKKDPSTPQAPGNPLVPAAGYGNYTVTATGTDWVTVIGTYNYDRVHNINTYLDYHFFQPAISAGTTVNGDTIVADAGTYIESNILVDESLTIIGQSRNGVIVVPAAEDGNADNAFNNSAQNGFIIKANNITIKDLTINGRGNTGLTPGKNNFRAGIVSADASYPGGGGGAWNNLNVYNVFIRHAYRRGISVYPVTVSGTKIENTRVDSTAFNHGMYLGGQSEAINDTIKHCFQGIVQGLDATTPAGLCKVNGNILTGIGNFPGCWGYIAGPPVAYNGQPRAIQFNNADLAGRQVEIKNNTITDNGFEQFAGVVGIYTRLANAASEVSGNDITLTSGVSWAGTGSQNVGMLLGWSYDNGFLTKNNIIHSTKYGIGVMVFGNGTVTNPLILEGNTISSTGSLRLDEGDGTGIYIANKYLFNTDANPSYVIIRNDNTISGFVKGIEVIKGGTSTHDLTVIVQDNAASIFGNTVGIDASYGSLTVTANDIYSNVTGIKLSGTANLVSATNNFIRINTGDGILIDAGTTGTIGAITNNSITGNLGYGINDLMASPTVNATCNWWGDGINVVNGNVDYIPYLSDGSDTGSDPSNGFQPGGTCDTPVNFYVNDATANGPYATGTGDDNNLGTSSAPLRTIQRAIFLAAGVVGETIWADAGSYPENLNVNKSNLLLKGAYFGTPGCDAGRTGAESIIAGTTGTAVTIATNNVTVDGFEMTGVAGVSNTGFTGVNISNNDILVGYTGIGMTGVNTATAGFTLQNNCIDLTGQLAGANPTVGIALLGINGTNAGTVSGNILKDAYYGYVIYNLTAGTTPTYTNITGGTITGCMQGVAIVNAYPPSSPVYLPSALTVSNIDMSSFNIDHAFTAGEIQAGVYVFTGGSENAATITMTLDDVNVDGTGRLGQDWAGMSFADFSTATLTLQDIMVNECTISNNKNRGINIRGDNADIEVAACTLNYNGADAYGIDDNDGFGIAVTKNAYADVHNCFITNPASSTTEVRALFTFTYSGGGGTIDAESNWLYNNGNTTNGLLAQNAGGTLTATCNWWGSDYTGDVLALVSGVDPTPFLTSGVDLGGDATDGFQPSVSCTGEPVKVYTDDTYSDLVATYTTIQKGVNGALPTYVVFPDAGNYPEQVTITKSLTLHGDNAITTKITAPTSGRLTIPNTTYSTTNGFDYVVAAYGTPASPIDVKIEGFTIDANVQDATTPASQNLVGVFMADVGGTGAGLTKCVVNNFGTYYSSWPRGNAGVWVLGNSVLTIGGVTPADGNNVSRYTTSGIVVNGYSTNYPDVVVQNNTVTGPNNLAYVVGHGIQAGYGTVADISDNDITGHIGASGSLGVYLYQPGTGCSVEGNDISNCYSGINLYQAQDATVTENTLYLLDFHGIAVSNTSGSTIDNNSITLTGTATHEAILLTNNSTNNIIGNLTKPNVISMPVSSTLEGGAPYLPFGIYVSGIGSGNNTIRYNTIDGAGAMIQVDGNSGTTTIDHNILGGTTSPSFRGIQFNGGSAVITYNELHNTVRPLEFWGVFNNTITGNEIDGSTFDAINLGSATGITNIAQNTITNSNSTGIMCRNGMHDVYIDCNEISNSLHGIYFESGCLSVLSITNNYIHHTSEPGSAITSFSALNPVNGNTISDNYRGIETSASIVAHYNRFINNPYGSMIWHTDDAHLIQNNWWNSADGPSIWLSGTNVASFNQSGQVEYIQANTYGNFVVAPWLTSGTDDQTTVCGFQPAAGTSFAPVYANADNSSTETEPYHSIQSAITGTGLAYIRAKYGTYTERPVVNKSVTITGIASGSNKPIITGSGTATVVSMITNNITLTGFKVQNSGSTGQDAGIMLRNDGTGGVTGCSVTGNEFSSNASGVAVILGSGNSITDNDINNNSEYGVVLIGSTGNTIQENEIYEITKDAIALDNLAAMTGDPLHETIASTGNYIKTNTIYDIDRDGVFIGYNCSNNQITNANDLDGIANIGIHVWRNGSQVITGNGITGALAGIKLRGMEDGVVTNNTINGNIVGIEVEAYYKNGWHPATNNSITANDLSGNTTYGLQADDVNQTVLVTAECNWWGSNDFSVISVYNVGNVDYIPWLVNGGDSDPGIGFVPTGACGGNPTISGTLKYNNPAKTPMNGVDLQLMSGTTEKATATTSSTGAYTFDDDAIDLGNYTIVPDENPKPWGSINSTDAAQVNTWSVAYSPAIEYTKFLAGDVVGSMGPDYWVKSQDAQKIQLRYVYGNTGSGVFDRGPWSYYKSNTLVGSGIPGVINLGPITVTVSTANLTGVNLLGQVTGDFNASYLWGAFKGGSANVNLTWNGSKEVGANADTDLPVHIVNASELSAISLTFSIPVDKMDVLDVTMKENNGALDWAVIGNELRIGWNSLSPLSFAAGEELLVIKLRTSDYFFQGESIKLDVTPDPINELADASLNVIPGAELTIATLESNALGTPDQAEIESLTLASYPNPFADYTMLKYTLPTDGRVTLEISNILGMKVATVVDEQQTGGTYSLKLDALPLQPGVYTATIKLDTNGDDLVRTIKLVKNR